MSEQRRNVSGDSKHPSTTVTAPSGEEDTIDLLDLASYCLSKWWAIVVGILIGGLVGGIFTSSFITPMYSSTGKLFLADTSDSIINLSDLQLSNNIIGDYQELISTEDVVEQVFYNLGGKYNLSNIRDGLTISNPSGTHVLNVTVTDSDPEAAAAIANEYMNVICEYAVAIMNVERPSIMARPRVNYVTITASARRNALLGGLLGAVLALGVMVVIYLLDDRLDTPEKVLRATGLQTMGILPVEKDMERKGRYYGHYELNDAGTTKRGKKRQDGERK